MLTQRSALMCGQHPWVGRDQPGWKNFPAESGQGRKLGTRGFRPTFTDKERAREVAGLAGAPTSERGRAGDILCSWRLAAPPRGWEL